MQEAHTLATSTQILMNVSEFDDVSKATDTLISSIQAFKYTSEESMDVVDILNTIGNNYAISTADLAQSLTKSSGSLVAANGTLEEAVALTATANTLIQDADVVGTALKTVAMRVRGTSTEEMEEEGVETDGVVSQSKLRSKIQGLAGVDILTDTGAYKSTYQILSEIAEVWEDMNDMDQAALLELLAGKRAGSVMSAILQNPQTLKDAFESASDATGSAMIENEKYLDSIQGRLDLFTNAVQTMWNDTLNSDLLKFIINIGTQLIKLADGIDIAGHKIGNLWTTVLGVIILITKKITKLSWGEYFANISKSISNAGIKMLNYAKGLMGATTASKALTAQTLQQQVATNAITQMEAIRQATTNGLVLSEVALTDAEATRLMTEAGLSDVEAQAIVNKLGLTSAAQKLTLTELQQAVINGKLTASEAARLGVATGLLASTVSLTGAQATQILTTQGVSEAEAAEIVTALGLGEALKPVTAETIMLAVANGQLAPELAATALGMLTMGESAKGAAGGIAALWATLWPMLIVLGGIAIIYGAVKIFDSILVSAEEASEQLQETKNTISSLESELESLQTSLEETKDKIAELTSLPSLSLTQQEDLDRLEREVELLEREIALKERQLAIEEAQLVEDAKLVIDKKWNKSGAYDLTNDGEIQEDRWFTWGESGEDVIDKAIDQYAKNAQSIKEAEELLSLWDDYEKGDVSEDIAAKLSSYKTEEDLITAIEDAKVTQTAIASSIEGFFNDPDYAGLTYGMSDEIDEFLDDFNNAQLKWEKALYGDSSTASAIESLWGPNASEETKAIKDKIDKIMAEEGNWASDEEKWQSKNKAITAYINTLDEAAEGYHQLDYVMNELGVSAQDIADYFTVLNGEFNSKTIEGVTKQYAKATEVINQFKAGASVAGIDSDGNKISISFDDLFTFDDKTKEWQADVEKVSQILEGADEKTREQFAKYVANIKNAQQEAEDAGKDFDITAAFAQASKNMEIDGLLRAIDITKESLSSINQITFHDIKDEIDGLIDTFSEFGNALEDTASAMDTLYKAQEQMNSSGRISVKTALELMQSTEDWNSVLEVNGETITLQDNAEQSLIQSRLNLIEQNINTALSEAELRYAKLEGADATLLQGDADLTTVEAQKEFDKAMNQSTAVSAGLGAAAGNLIEKLKALANLDFDSNAWDTSAISAFNTAYDSALTVLDEQSGLETTEDLEQKIANLRAQKDMIGQLKSDPDAFKNYYDYDKTPGDKYGNSTSDKFQKAMDYWENRIGANQARYEQVQNEIDLLDTKGKKAGKEYYEEQIKLEEQRLGLLEAQKAEAQSFLGTFKEGSEEWWDAANTLNNIEGEIDDVTSSIQDLSDAMAEVDWYIFDETHERFSSLIDDLETIRDLIAPNAEEDWFDDEGMWTEKGVASLATYVQALEMYENALDEVNVKLKDYSKQYAGNEAYYKKLGIDSEQELYDAREKLIDQQYEYAQSISDSEQSVVDMYEAQIDAIEEYTSELVESYNEYIDVVKEALDAERDLYEFKKDVEKQTKDINELERRIASLSGSDNAADIAERRKLEAELYEAKEGLNDTYYDHAKDSQMTALEEEAEAYEKSLNDYVEKLRDTLEEAQLNMAEFMGAVTQSVILNADIVKEQYIETGITLDDALVKPWDNAIAEISRYETDGLSKMNSWTTEEGFFGKFKTDATNQLKSPWTEATKSVNSFKDSVDTAMKNVVSNIRTNVSNSITELNKLQTEMNKINDTAVRPTVTSGGGGGGGNGGGGGGDVPSDDDVKALQAVLNQVFGHKLTIDGKYGPATQKAVGETQIALKQTVAPSLVADGQYGEDTKKAMAKWIDKKIESIKNNNSGSSYIGAGIRHYTDYKNKLPPAFYAKGTLGTKRDEWAITDEPWLGDELTMYATKQGTLSYMRAGSTVVPADLTKELISIGEVGLDGLTNMPKFDSGVNLMSNVVNKPEFNFTFDNLLHIDNCTNEVLPEVKKLVESQIDKFTRQLNYSLKKVGAR